MANKSNKKQAPASATAATTAPKYKPKVVLRTYQASDHEEVEYLFRSSSAPLVFESMRSKIWSPATWFIWFGVYTILLLVLPKTVSTRIVELSGWYDTLFRAFITFCWAVVSVIILFVTSDRIELQNYIDEALANDLKDPELYYLNYTLDSDGNKVRKAPEEHMPSHFWVLTLDDEICGMVGLSSNAEDVLDQRTMLPVPWKQFTCAILELLHLPVPAMLEQGRVNDKEIIFANKQVPRTATITRLYVRTDAQTCGFSTLLVNRAMAFAEEHGVNRVYAMVDERNMAAEQILTRRHNFIIMKKHRLNSFGKFRYLYACRVHEWMENNGDKIRKVFKKSETTK
ncbi:hypothetical protein INT47_009623 [Mucor saturninus]|uniref:N-acetyltransferase domain-containing protein n=1 Tax=Mucor saturninus TaxID=64648 RepID=A0A8H7QQ37_9FUNG|nr:hypothetical protein INT47_009623 [Mucor saturninus]